MLNGKGPSSMATERNRRQHVGRASSIVPASMNNETGYPSPAEPSPPLNMLSHYEEPPFDGMYMSKDKQDGHPHSSDLRVNTTLAQASITDGVRTFPCTSCGKGFARRSDLARHGQHMLGHIQ